MDTKTFIKIRDMEYNTFVYWNTFPKQFIWIVPLCLLCIIFNGGWIIIASLVVFAIYGLYMQSLTITYIEIIKQRFDKHKKDI